MDDLQAIWDVKFDKLQREGSTLGGEPWLERWLHLVPPAGCRSALDVGCGSGQNTRLLLDQGFEVTAIDISGKLIAIAEQRTAEQNPNNVEFIRTSVFDERFQPGSFDVVMAFFVLHFFEDIDAVMKRVHELLKPGGIFISETACLGEKLLLLNTVELQ